MPSDARHAGERLVGQRRAGAVDGGAAEEVLLGLDVGRELGQDAQRGVHDLRPDAVAGQGDDVVKRWPPC
jgi:hypothetical protein